MKILGGTLKGRNFFMPERMRPTQNLTRKAVFDILGQDMEGLEFLELFAGSGAVGLEALSRGAKRVTFVEKDMKFAEVIAENMRLLGLDEPLGMSVRVELMNTDAFAAIKELSRRASKYHVIFLDPPYGEGLAKKALKSLEGCDILHPNSFVLIEHAKEEPLTKETSRFKLVKERKYGASFLTVYECS